MYLLAVSDAVWLGLIGIITMIVKEGLDQWRARQSRERSETITEIVKDVRHETNSMKDKLVKVTGEEALSRGGMEERARADQRQLDADALESVRERQNQT